MQNKSAIWVFTILLAVACLYQLSFTWVASGIDDDAKEYALEKLDSVKNSGSLTAVNGEFNALEVEEVRGKYEAKYLAKKANEEVYLGFTYAKVKKQELSLGLDLQGGMNVTLEISVVDVIRALSGYSKDENFNKAIVNAVEMQNNSQDDFVTLFGNAYADIDANARLSAIFHTRENKEKFPREATNEEILLIIQEEADDAIKRTEQVIRKRIDNLGVVQPKVQRLEGSGRILVELPGVKNKSRVRKILQGTAKLEFWETHDNTAIYNNLAEANTMLGKKLVASEKVEKDTVVTEEIVAESVADSSAVDILADLGGVDSLGVDSVPEEAKTQEELAKENPIFSILTPAYGRNADGQTILTPGPVVGYASIADTAQVNEYLARKDVKLLMPPRAKFFWGVKSSGDDGTFLPLYAIKVTNRDGRAPLEGDAVSDAKRSADPLGNPEISMSMNADGAKSWKNLTKTVSDGNVGDRKGCIAIVLDNFVYSAPTVSGEIAGGQSSISGRFTVEEAEDLANVLKAGKLPAPARIIEEAIVGPSLGEESIADGMRSFIFALLVILAYMIFYYSKAGAVSDIALVANIFFVLGVLASLGATLTLPGIAGIVLTIGMSVDANVLIYERIREELSQGKGIKLAIQDGYNNAYSSIIDANITTLLTGIVLLVFGSGPIKGFATTLIIGICTSLFSAIFITRLIFEYQLGKGSAISFASKMSEGAFKNTSISFIAKRKLFYLISGLVIVAGIGSFITRGFDQGVDFTGGRTYQVRFDKEADMEGIRENLASVFIEDGVTQTPEVKIFGSSNQVKITTKYMINSTAEDAEDVVGETLENGLNKIGDSYEIMSSQKVGPTIADDLKVDAMWSVLVALLIIFLYIVLRFRRWQFGLGALVAMVHDVLIVLSIFSIFYGILPFSLEIDQAFIAAILTVVGYSINDTVVVFDRIREHLGLHKRKELGAVLDGALNSTLSRTFNTSISTFFVLLMIFIFGGDVIKGFVFALMVGVVVGTYSSLCVATPIVLDLDKGKTDK